MAERVVRSLRNLQPTLEGKYVSSVDTMPSDVGPFQSCIQHNCENQVWDHKSKQSI